MTVAKEMKTTWDRNMSHVIENVKRNKSLQAIGRFFTNATNRGEMDGMSIADVKKKVEELTGTPANLRSKEPKEIRLSVPGSGEPTRSTLADARLNATIDAQSKQIATLTAKVEELTAALPQKLTRDTTKLQGCYLAAFGAEKYREVLSRNKIDEALNLMERQICLSGLKVEGYDFNETIKNYGEPKALFGLRRLEVGRQQEQIDKYLGIRK
jgi:hypothetical protein